MRPLSFQWMPTYLTSCPTSFYLISLQLSLGSPSTALFPFLNISLMAKFFPRLKIFRCIFGSSWGPSKLSLSLLYKAFLRPLFAYASPGWFPLLSATDLSKLERLHRAASHAISSCLISSPIALLLSEASIPPLQVTLIHFTLSSYECAFVSQSPFSFQVWPDLEWN